MYSNKQAISLKTKRAFFIALSLAYHIFAIPFDKTFKYDNGPLCSCIYSLVCDDHEMKTLVTLYWF